VYFYQQHVFFVSGILVKKESLEGGGPLSKTECGKSNALIISIIEFVVLSK